MGAVAFSKCHKNSKLHFYSYAQVRVTWRLVSGDGEEGVGRKGEKAGSRGRGCGQSGSLAPGVTGNTRLSLLPPLCSQGGAFSGHRQGQLMQTEV